MDKETIIDTLTVGFKWTFPPQTRQFFQGNFLEEVFERNFSGEIFGFC